MIIQSAEFSISSARVNQCPQGDKPEYAFIGRSNVGKSSLINMLCQRKKLAMTSATPGKTALINHFIINKEWYMVDLPGYGFAKRSKTTQKKFEELIRDYILLRTQMANLFLLIDIRHSPQAIDLEFIEWLGISHIPFSIVFTKADKLTRPQIQANTENYMKALSEKWEELPPYFITSSEKGLGRDEILSYIESINKSIAQK
ncbi:MAG: ribosome biogenesis GTP-binding protein YihA/YsxC [Bacteroidaceae bacterium]|jgi:GTP-binding protein